MKRRTKVFSITMADLRMDTFRAGGKGGQNQNKVNSGVRLTHEPSGAVGEARDERDQAVNKKRAFERLTQSKEFASWLELQKAIIRGEIKYEEQDGKGNFQEIKLEPGK